MKKIKEMNTPEMEEELGTNTVEIIRKKVVEEKLYEAYKYGY